MKIFESTTLLVAGTILFVYCLGTYAECKRLDYNYNYKINSDDYNSDLNDPLLAQEDETYYFGKTFPEVEVTATEIKNRLP